MGSITTQTPLRRPRHSLFEVRDAPGAGRGVFATHDISCGTTVHIAADLTAHILLREYRGEICWQCFAYNRGKKLPLRDVRHGFTFCSKDCETKLRAGYDDVCLEAWAAVEKLARSRTRRDTNEDLMNGHDGRPTLSSIDEAWKLAQQTAARIFSARTGSMAQGGTRDQRKALQQALDRTPSTDVLAFQIHTILTRYRCPENWGSILSLEEDDCPYMSAQELADHIASYLQLMSVLPQDLLRFVTPETLREIKTHEVHNSFGIRSLEDEGAEFFGYGVWPSASYFNHSCAPNVHRRRVGRTWVFEASSDVSAGQELQISYLNGEETTLNLTDRRARLNQTWSFHCACQQCGSK